MPIRKILKVEQYGLRPARRLVELHTDDPDLAIIRAFESARFETGLTLYRLETMLDQNPFATLILVDEDGQVIRQLPYEPVESPTLPEARRDADPMAD